MKNYRKQNGCYNCKRQHQDNEQGIIIFVCRIKKNEYERIDQAGICDEWKKKK